MELKLMDTLKKDLVRIYNIQDGIVIMPLSLDEWYTVPRCTGSLILWYTT